MINPISFPAPQAYSGGADFTPLAKLGDVYREAQAEAAKQRALAQLGADPNANAQTLIRSGIPSLAQMGLNLQQQGVSNTRADRQLSIQEAQEKRAAENNEADSPTGRVKQLIEAGENPKDPKWREFIVTGQKAAATELTFPEQVAQRKKEALALGLKEDSPGYQSYVLTGKMPREDAQPLTATDKKIIHETDGLIISGAAGISSLNRAKALSKNAYAGPLAGAIGYGTSFLGKDSELGKSGIATENLENEVLSNALAQLKSIFGAAPTEGERKILVELQGSVKKPDAVRQDIYDRAILMAQNKLEEHKQMANNLRGGTYYKPGGGTISGGGATPAPGAAAPDPLGLR
jgi:hypothetical protein